MRRGEDIKDPWEDMEAVSPLVARIECQRNAGATEPLASSYPDFASLNPGTSSSRQPEQLLCIAVADLFLIRFRQADRLQHLDGVADVARACLLVDRTAGRK